MWTTADTVGVALLGAWAVSLPFAAWYAHGQQRKADERRWRRGRPDWEWGGDNGLCVLAAMTWPVLFPLAHLSGVWEPFRATAPPED